MSSIETIRIVREMLQGTIYQLSPEEPINDTDVFEALMLGQDDGEGPSWRVLCSILAQLMDEKDV